MTGPVKKSHCGNIQKSQFQPRIIFYQPFLFFDFLLTGLDMAIGSFAAVDKSEKE
jgi:hypothetical protein